MAERDEFYRVRLTSAEATATLAALRFLHRRAAEYAGFSEADAGIFQSAASRIEEDVPEFFGAEAEQMANALALLFGAPAASSVLEALEGADEKPPFPPEPRCETLQAALADGGEVEIEYYVASREEWSRRRVTINDVFEDGGNWYLRGHCHLRRDDRLFRVDNIRNVEIAPPKKRGRRKGSGKKDTG